MLVYVSTQCANVVATKVSSFPKMSTETLKSLGFQVEVFILIFTADSCVHNWNF